MRYFIFIILRITSFATIFNAGFAQNLNWERLESLPDASVLMINSRGNIYASNHISLFCSNDNGQHWLKMDSLSQFCPANDINSILQFDEKRMFISTDFHGLQMSTNNGLTWISFNTIPHSSAGLTVSRNNNGKIYYSSGGGSYYSIDTGKSWHRFKVDQHFSGVTKFAFNSSKYFLHSNIMDGKSGDQAIFLSNEENDSCRYIKCPDELYKPEIVSSNGQEYFVRDFWGNLFYSLDNGISWKKSDKRLSESLFCIVETLSGNLIASTEFDGIYFSLDKGKTWSKIFDQVNSRVTSLALHPSGHLYVGTKIGIFRSKIPTDDLCK